MQIRSRIAPNFSSVDGSSGEALDGLRVTVSPSLLNMLGIQSVDSLQHDFAPKKPSLRERLSILLTDPQNA